METQQLEPGRTRRRTWPGFPWAAFATGVTRRGSFASQISAHNAAGIALQRIDLGFAFDSECPDYSDLVPVPRPKPEPGCSGRELHKRWGRVRDPIDARQHRLI